MQYKNKKLKFSFRLNHVLLFIVHDNFKVFKEIYNFCEKKEHKILRIWLIFDLPQLLFNFFFAAFNYNQNL